VTLGCQSTRRGRLRLIRPYLVGREAGFLVGREAGSGLPSLVIRSFQSSRVIAVYCSDSFCASAALALKWLCYQDCLRDR